jgi:hypothetical protein
MSGFLQRLASGVLHPQPAIHPAVGTIWSAAGMNEPGMNEPLATAEPFESSVEVRAPLSPRRADAATQPSTQPPAKPQVQPERSADVPEGAVQAIVAAGAFQPLVAFPQRRVVSALPPVSQADADPQRQANSPPHDRAASPELTGPRPLHRIETTRTAPSSLPSSRRQAQPAPPLTGEPDSIEIHIGRIEVLAAAPRPAQPAAPRPARKSLDLAEYLRGERRSR